jgi:O-acetylhomoserine (thiol)-lyase
MPVPRPPALATLSLHAGQRPADGQAAVPIHHAAAFPLGDARRAAALYDQAESGHADGHLSNPTTALLEERLAALEGGVGAVATASGMAALHLALATLLRGGDQIVASAALSGSAVGLLTRTLPRFGITTRFVRPDDIDGFRRALCPATRLILGETIDGAGLGVLDIPQLATIARDAHLPLLIDNSRATPALCRPLDLGASLVVLSASQWLGGHGVTLGGALVDGGGFDWATAVEDDSGIDWYGRFGPAAFIARARLQGMADFGACLAPGEAFQILQGIATLGLRMDRHLANTGRILDFLAGSDAVAWVRHPALPGHPGQELAGRLMPRGAGAVIAFAINGGARAAAAALPALRLIRHAAAEGTAVSSIHQPATTTHRHTDPRHRAEAGIAPDMLVLSVGLEDADDIIADLSHALRAATRD